MKLNTEGKVFRSALGAVLVVLGGLLLWKAPLGDPWVNASYDYLFRFGAHPVTNSVVLVLMDEEAYDQFHQSRDHPWDRGLHAELLRRLAADGCSLVVFDSFFRAPLDPVSDKALADAMRSQRRVVLMTEQASVTYPDLVGARPVLPDASFLEAAGSNNWGVACVNPDLDKIVRKHWPFPSSDSYPSLPWTAARMAGARLSDEAEPRWLRYYGQEGPWARLGYRFALSQATNYYRNKIVFIGNQSKTTVPDGERDKFRTPYTRWTGEASGGVEILATSFLNLVNGDWLRRPPRWTEVFVLILAGVLLGGGLCQCRVRTACAIAVAAALAVSIGAVCFSQFSNYWFPWLIIVGAQVPCAFVFCLAVQRVRVATTVAVGSSARMVVPASAAVAELDIPDYELAQPAFGHGAYGKVWLARNAIGQWQALKVVYLANFNNDREPYEREFNGIRRYKPVSDQHPGLLRVDFVSRMKPGGYFYYVMELGDSLVPGWEEDASKYKPRDLVNERKQSLGQKVPARECVRIGLALTEALEFLHQNGLTHRDIKPQNILFVNGHPKLADVGLMSEIHTEDRQGTQVGTPGYMPPLPESPGTAQADIYALGMVLYVLSTGRSPSAFPEISTTLVNSTGLADFFALNAAILKACHPDRAQRYRTAAEMREALETARKALENESTGKLAAQAT